MAIFDPMAYLEQIKKLNAYNAALKTGKNPDILTKSTTTLSPVQQAQAVASGSALSVTPGKSTTGLAAGIVKPITTPLNTGSVPTYQSSSLTILPKGANVGSASVQAAPVKTSSSPSYTNIAGRSLTGTMTGTPTTGMTGTQTAGTAGTIGTTGRTLGAGTTGLANYQSGLREIDQYFKSTQQSPQALIQQLGTQLGQIMNPNVMSGALGDYNALRQKSVTSIYDTSMDLIKEKQQQDADFAEMLMNSYSEYAPTFLPSLTSEEFQMLKGGQLTPEMQMKLQSAQQKAQAMGVTAKPTTEKIGDTLYQYNPDTGKWDVAIGAGAPGVTPGSQYAEEKANRTIQTVDELLTQAQAEPGIFGRTAAMPIPEWLRSDAYRNYQALLSKLESNIGFAELTEMREASKTGGALGQVSERELALLTSTLGALKMSQDPEQIMQQLQTVKESTMRWQIAKQGYTAQEIEDAAQQLGGIEQVYQGLFNKPVSSGEKSSAITTAYNDGQRGGQCGTFAHNIVNFPPVGDSRAEKIASVEKYGIPYYQWQQNPQVGDVLITDESKKYGHVAVVNAVLPDGTVQLTESNMVPPNAEAVSNTRRIAIDSPRIYGAIRGNLKV